MKSNKRVLISSILCGLMATGNSISYAQGDENTRVESAPSVIASEPCVEACCGENCGNDCASKGNESSNAQEENSSEVQTKNKVDGNNVDCAVNNSESNEIKQEPSSEVQVESNFKGDVLENAEVVNEKVDDNNIPLKISFSPELEKATIDMMGALSDIIKQTSNTFNGASSDFSSLSNLSPEDMKGLMNTVSGMLEQMSWACREVSYNLPSKPLSPIVSQKDFEQNRSKFYPACVSLKSGAIDLSKPIYYTIRWQESLREIAKKFLGSVDKASLISDIPENAKVISSIAAKDYLPEYETLVLPQPANADYVLYAPKKGENYYDVARIFYGSWVYAPALAKYNDNNYLDSIYESVIKLPKNLDLNSYVADNGDTLVKLSKNLFGTEHYASQIAKLNNLSDIDKPLKRGMCLKMPCVEQSFVIS